MAGLLQEIRCVLFYEDPQVSSWEEDHLCPGLDCLCGRSQ